MTTPRTPTAIRLHIARRIPNSADLSDHLTEMFNRTIQVGPDVTIPLAQYRGALATAALILECSVQDLIDAYDLRLKL